ncbi:MAG: insulinase family protein [Bacteroidales bacterium]|nr:insulinase family protein [Bacteroidales bacterium]
MKRKSIILLIVFAVLLGFKAANAQEQPKVETFYLDNGLKVVLYEDHSEPTVHGTVFVHAGSKNDPLDATGMAHYFEHIMFKGTDKIGTTNWEAEKVYLDSIDIMYDKLHDTENPEERTAIQKKINELSLASAEYAIPNEVDLILTKMGGEGLNAGTSYDYTVYFNSFPSNQIEKWMDVYVERFRNPVFRLFQSELETVYEEKNMYSDGPIAAFTEMMMKECFGEHPYGRPIIGLSEHLKNPQTTKMREFYQTYYAANNMTLILVGDFNTEDIKPVVAEKFSAWEKREMPEMPEFQLPTFESEVVKEVNLTPIKMGTILYKGVSNKHEDNVALEMLSYIMSNGTTGLYDMATLNNELMGAYMAPLSLEDHGVVAFIYIPKIIGQSHEKAEAILFKGIDDVKSGNFSDDLFEAAKTETLKSRLMNLEGINNVSYLLIDNEGKDMSFEDYLAETEVIKNMTKEDLVAVANKYLNENRKILRSKMGFPAKDKIEKPNWKPIEAKNTEAKSDFAMFIEGQDVSEVEPQVVEFGKDVMIEKANDAFTMYSAKNPYNNIFDLTINYNYGSISNPDVMSAVMLWDMLGTESKTYEEVELALNKLGASMSLYVSEDHAALSISGFDENMEEILAICEDKIFNPKFDASKLNIMLQNEVSANQMAKDDADTWEDAMHQYVYYGENSSYLNDTPMKEWIKRDENSILDDVKEIFNYNGYVTYTGNVETQKVIALLNSHNLIKNDAVKAEKKIRQVNEYDKDVVYFAHNKKFRQSKISMYVPSVKLSNDEKTLSQVYNKYFGTDMYSVVFQEVREFRSLGYYSYAYYKYDYLNRKIGNLYAAVGTQSDKTNEAVDVLRGLIVDMPERMEKFDTSKEALVMSRAADYVAPRRLPSTVAYWIETGYDSDPRIDVTNYIKGITYEDIYKFYQEKVQGRPIVIMIAGNKKDVDIKALEKYGEVKFLKFDQIYK